MTQSNPYTRTFCIENNPIIFTVQAVTESIMLRGFASLEVG